MKFSECVEIVGSKPSRYQGIKQYVSTGALDSDHIDENSIEEYAYDDRPSRADLVAEAGNVLFAKMAETKKTLVINNQNEKYLFSTGFFAVKPKKNVLTTECLYYLLNSNTFLSQKDKYSSGATQKAISNAGLEKIIVNIPCFSKQEDIVKQLDKLSNIIKKTRKQLLNFDLLIKSRFIEMFGDPVENQYNWPESLLCNIADIVSGITKGRKTKETELFEVPYMAVSNVKAGYIDWTTVKSIYATKSEIQAYQLKINDVLMTEGGDPDKVGRGALLTSVPDNCIHQNHIFRVRFDESFNPLYFAEYLQHSKAKKYFFKCAKQTTGIASINMGQLKKLPVLIPPLELQQQFASFVQQIDKSKFVVQKSLEKAETLYKSLMQEYFG